MSNSNFKKIRDYYNDKIDKFGITAKGVDWNSKESQELRFEKLLCICDFSKEFSINDYGCGFGALYDYLKGKTAKFAYAGYDISLKMVQSAREIYGEFSNCVFLVEEDKLRNANYTVASGIFNIKLDIHPLEWEKHIKETLNKINKISRDGFAFNMLTRYSDYMRDDLYYGDPCFYFDYCKRTFSKNIALCHDYGLFEFAIIVRK